MGDPTSPAGIFSPVGSKTENNVLLDMHDISSFQIVSSHMFSLLLSGRSKEIVQFESGIFCKSLREGGRIHTPKKDHKGIREVTIR